MAARNSETLRGADVILCPDNDDAGRKHMDDAAASLQGVARPVRLLTLPGLPPKGDVSDWIKAGGTREQLDLLIEHAPDWQPQAEPQPGHGIKLTSSTSSKSQRRSHG